MLLTSTDALDLKVKATFLQTDYYLLSAYLIQIDYLLYYMSELLAVDSSKIISSQYLLWYTKYSRYRKSLSYVDVFICVWQRKGTCLATQPLPHTKTSWLRKFQFYFQKTNVLRNVMIFIM